MFGKFDVAAFMDCRRAFENSSGFWEISWSWIRFKAVGVPLWDDMLGDDTVGEGVDDLY